MIDIADFLGLMPPRPLASHAEAEWETRYRKLARTPDPSEAQEDDCHAWDLITLWLRREPCCAHYALMDDAATRAAAHLQKLADAEPEDGALAARLAQVREIQAGVQRTRAYYDGLNAEIRRRIAQDRAASAGDANRAAVVGAIAGRAA